MYYLFSNLKLNTMKICFIPVILLYLLTPLAAQSDISRPIGYAAYLRSVSLSGETDKNGTCVLLFNTSGSLFIHSEVVRPDSTYSDPEYVFPVTIRGDKQGGLPGLILEAKSTDGKVQFLFKELVLSKNINSSIVPPEGFATGLDYGTFREEKEAFDKNLIKSSQAQGIQLRISSLEMIEQ